jgi:hypothetical protein
MKTATIYSVTVGNKTFEVDSLVQVADVAKKYKDSDIVVKRDEASFLTGKGQELYTKLTRPLAVAARVAAVYAQVNR